MQSFWGNPIPDSRPHLGDHHFGSLIDDMMARMRADRPGITIDVATSNDGDVWQAIVSAGFADGAWPKWQATGASRSEAIEDAMQTALDYWTPRKGRPDG